MKIVAGKFPWKQLYLGLFFFVAVLGAYWILFPRSNHALGPEVPFFGAAVTAWSAFLTIKSGVAPARFGSDHLRSTSSVAFWFEVMFLVVLSVLFVLMGVFW